MTLLIAVLIFGLWILKENHYYNLKNKEKTKVENQQNSELNTPDQQAKNLNTNDYEKNNGDISLKRRDLSQSIQHKRKLEIPEIERELKRKKLEKERLETSRFEEDEFRKTYIDSEVESSPKSIVEDKSLSKNAILFGIVFSEIIDKPVSLRKK